MSPLNNYNLTIILKRQIHGALENSTFYKYVINFIVVF